MAGALHLPACDQAATDLTPTRDAGVVDVAAAPADAADLDGGAGVTFRACPGYFSGACAKVEVPLDYVNPQGRKIEILVDRIVSSTKPKAALWLLQGGPGGSGADMVRMALRLGGALPEFEVYTLDHRGVGLSERLGCPQEAEWRVTDAGPAFDDAGLPQLAPFYKPCIDAVNAQWGADLRHFTTSNAARDLAAIIEKTRRPGQQVFVYGVSYGTYWAHRYLQVAPTQAAGIVLDSVVPSDGQFMSGFDGQFDPAARKLAELCKTDALCTAKLGADPWAKIVAIRAEMDTGHCPAFGVTLEDRLMWSALLTARVTTPMAFAALYRFDRCGVADVTLLQELRKRFNTVFGGPNRELFSELLYMNVAFSELWETPAPTYDALLARLRASVFGSGVAFRGQLQPLWTPYPRDELMRAWAQTRVPMLMINGTLDCQTPIETAELVKPHFTAPGQTFVTVPNANHGVIDQSPVKRARAEPCGFQVITSFLTKTSQGLNEAPDVSCLADLEPIDFRGDIEANGYLMGTNDIWTGYVDRGGGFDPGRMPVSLEPLRRTTRWMRAREPR